MISFLNSFGVHYRNSDIAEKVLSNFSSNCGPNSLNMFLNGSSFNFRLSDVTSTFAGPSWLGCRRLSREMGSTFECTRPARCTIFMLGNAANIKPHYTRPVGNYTLNVYRRVVKIPFPFANWGLDLLKDRGHGEITGV
ncbi:uncharacterized protein LACBIDRAFT_329799 [Laccaria bicolor S238N-H82]|uniref:Predicted protein n=1 Tax=Laccaria bicolor (strain S238N-H82 / ATCC MYA-4686) TaxID=486041 RepID=B0DJ97_LACBS|nr:uncharacterized protein LACBIDRAFT_329799 [Laccaria bicolor S238N-H82]EDR05484.1 predicted protein [Laccaria bicolor S238N-H82]|eukprot:XP_001884042.1 predicted protein [Laccaria bicolor S238N-H82]